MNVNDFKSKIPYDEKHALEDIFQYQHELAEKYLHIEKQNGLLQSDRIPGDVHDRFVQARLKDMTWRAMEEVAEAMEAILKTDILHFEEELADAFHFVVEKMLIAGYNPNKPLQWYFDNSMGNPAESIKSAVTDYLVAAGLACNTLKNKPWKTTHMLTDINKFQKLTEIEFQSFIDLCKAGGFTAESLFHMYMRKNQVNQFRQRSGY
jgi:hypothetical protein